jgi:penicillin-binding protein 2
MAVASGSAFGLTTQHRRKHVHKVASIVAVKQTSGSTAVLKRASFTSVSTTSTTRKRRYFVEPYTSPTFADSTAGDLVDGEDLVVRRAAVDALGPYNGSVVVLDPHTGRILTIVNQKLAFESGFQPCSTIKLMATLAGLNEGVIDENTTVRIGRRTSLNLTEAIAHSNNYYFSLVGQKLGYDRIVQYAHLFGLGEKAALDIPQEEPGTLASAPPEDGVGMMTSFGEGITITPLELASLVSIIANGGTLYYLQYPRTPEAIAQFVPRVKRRLDISQWIPEMLPGMMGAVEYGTARRANFSDEDPVLGKTGTCTDTRTPTHLGWFGSFNKIGQNQLVVVVLLTGGHRVNGPVASGIAGAIYRTLDEESYFGKSRMISPMALISTQSCCR